ncbi:MAG TPA: RidA family protein [Acidimicrobiia bacterium]|nr:RidA family protein [Acidimicrobiia bacterium]
MSVSYVNPGQVMAPAGQYSHVAVAEPGRLAFIAGQVALDADGELVGVGDPGAQFRQIFSNLAAILDSLGATPTDVADLKTYLVGEESLASFRDARQAVFAQYYPDGAYPPNTLLIVSGLVHPDLKVEVSATARVP